MQKGGVLALTGDAVVSIYSRNLDAVDYEVAQIRPEFLNTFLLANLDQLDYDNYDYDQPYTGSRPVLTILSVISRGACRCSGVTPCRPSSARSICAPCSATVRKAVLSQPHRSARRRQRE